MCALSIESRLKYYHHQAFNNTLLITLRKSLMQNDKSPVIKGLISLRNVERGEELRAASKSPYYVWWRYLRLSKDYWWVCKQNGETLDSELRRLWVDFGDVFDTNFPNWWVKHARKLFAESVRLPHVRQIDPSRDELHDDPTQYVIVEIPLNVTERTISRQVLTIVRNHPNRKINPVSTAARQLAKWRGIKMAVLKDAQTIWGVVHMVELAKQGCEHVPVEFRNISHYHIGVKLHLVGSCMPSPTDSDDKARRKRNGMKVAVTRMLTRANALIANAEIGIFPSFEKLAPRQRWTEEQRKDLEEAIANGLWQPPDVSLNEVRRYLKLPDPKMAAMRNAALERMRNANNSSC
jgi:hypothetical protein